ncbi:MAG: hypothetical protein JW863_22070 [Chitinispirillaceae bacterium]|nr:hypothetical protein [Chitinispirillaceae bacterium]
MMILLLKSINYPEVKSIGIRFFDNAERLDEAALEKCGLTKAEMKEALEEFRGT